jgi:hypothetical protein
MKELIINIVELSCWLISWYCIMQSFVALSCEEKVKGELAKQYTKRSCGLWALLALMFGATGSILIFI